MFNQIVHQASCMHVRALGVGIVSIIVCGATKQRRVQAVSADASCRYNRVSFLTDYV